MMMGTKVMTYNITRTIEMRPILVLVLFWGNHIAHVFHELIHYYVLKCVLL